MTDSQNNLLQRLEPIIPPKGVLARSEDTRSSLHTRDANGPSTTVSPFGITGDTSAIKGEFGRLIKLAIRGELTTGITLSTQTGIEIPKDRQLAIAAAADRAEATGAKRAAVFMDGRSFLLDVPKHHITEELTHFEKSDTVDEQTHSQMHERIITDIDTVIIMPSESAGSQTDSEETSGHASALIHKLQRPWSASVNALLNTQTHFEAIEPKSA